MRTTPVGTLMVASACVIAGCSTMEDTSPKFGLTQKTDADFSRQFATERAHLKNGEQPRIGLALSGGGTKAAIFSHGVLHGLHDAGVLKHVDIISSVSGGGYAAYWYYSKLIEGNRENFNSEAPFQDCFPAWWEGKEDNQHLKNVFAAGKASALQNGSKVCDSSSHFTENDPFRWQAHLLRWPDLFQSKITHVTGNPQSAPKQEQKNLLLSALFEMTLGWTGIESKLVKSYQGGIERTWGLNPIPRGENSTSHLIENDLAWNYSNIEPATDETEMLRVDSKKMSWNELNNLYKGPTPPPLWVINTTEGNKGKKPNLGTLFELTPFGYGSVTRGYQSGMPPVKDIATGVRAAAAFADSQGLADEGQRTVLNIIASFLPAARWGVTIQPENAASFRLSDGGGSDNLGIVSLVRRGLSDVIVVDTSEDRKGMMADLCWSKLALEQEGLSVKFNQLEDFDMLCRDNAKTGGPKHAYNISAWTNPITKGIVEWGPSGKKTNIWHIKAAWNQQAVRKAYNKIECGPAPEKINCTLLLFYGHNTTVADPSDGYMIFPQHGTVSSTLNGSSYITLAYRELGRMLASQLRLAPDRSLTIQNDKDCMQPIYPAQKNRPGPKLGSIPANETCRKAVN